MFTLLSSTSTPATLIRSGLELYKRGLRQVIGFALLANTFFLMPLYSHHVIPSQEDSFITSALLVVICWIASLTLSLALIFHLHCLCYGITCSAVQSLKQACYRLIPTLLVLALYIIIVVSGTMVLILPGFILSVSLMFAFLLCLNENKGVFMSLMTSHQLVWGQWWHTFIVMSVPLLLTLTLFLALFLLIAGIFSNALFNIQGWYYYLFGAQLILHSLLLPFTYSVALVLFNDLRVRQRQSMQPY